MEESLFYFFFFFTKPEYIGGYHGIVVILIETDLKTRWWQEATSNSVAYLTNLNFPNHKSFNLHLENCSAGGLIQQDVWLACFNAASQRITQKNITKGQAEMNITCNIFGSDLSKQNKNRQLRDTVNSRIYEKGSRYKR